MLDRSTEWRQGGLLTFESSLELGLFKNEATDHSAVVISHDCDIPNDKEESIEVIIGKKLIAVDTSLVAAKNIRRIHLRYRSSAPNQELFIELQRPGHRSVKKENFVTTAKLDSNFELPIDEKRTLKQWLAARYGRPAFPNEFENRFGNNKKFEEKLIKILKPLNAYLIGLFFDLGEERFTELASGNPYFLRIFIVYESVHGLVARQIAEECASSIKELFYKFYGTPDMATDLVLENCFAVADINFSLADIRKSDQWRLEYISLREVPAAPYLSIG